MMDNQSFEKDRLAFLDPFNENESNTDQQDHAVSSDYLIHTLSGWLTNIRRIKTHAASHQ